jgi:hypothetical protein
VAGDRRGATPGLAAGEIESVRLGGPIPAVGAAGTRDPQR